MHLIQLLLPLYDNEDQRFSESMYAGVREELLKHFGGVTIYSRAPAKGLWQQGATLGVGGAEAVQNPHRDELLIHEVMVEKLDEIWWAEYRRELEQRFRQLTLVVRAHEIQLL